MRRTSKVAQTPIHTRDHQGHLVSPAGWRDTATRLQASVVTESRPCGPDEMSAPTWGTQECRPMRLRALLDSSLHTKEARTRLNTHLLATVGG